MNGEVPILRKELLTEENHISVRGDIYYKSKYSETNSYNEYLDISTGAMYGITNLWELGFFTGGNIEIEREKKIESISYEENYNFSNFAINSSYQIKKENIPLVVFGSIFLIENDRFPDRSVRDRSDIVYQYKLLYLKTLSVGFSTIIVKEPVAFGFQVAYKAALERKIDFNVVDPGDSLLVLTKANFLVNPEIRFEWGFKWQYYQPTVINTKVSNVGGTEIAWLMAASIQFYDNWNITVKLEKSFTESNSSVIACSLIRDIKW